MIGIYGGTFDPVHFGHLRTALEVSDKLALDSLRMIPCRIPAHRDEPEISAADRLSMLQLALKGVSGVQADARELSRSGPSYSVDTLKEIRQEISVSAPLCMVLGSDSFLSLPSWHKWQDIFDLCHIVVLKRPGFNSICLNGPLDDFVSKRKIVCNTDLLKEPAGLVMELQVTQLDISASFIRSELAARRSARFLVPDIVLDFIEENELYLSKQSSHD